jgi:hypothetical protein
MRIRTRQLQRSLTGRGSPAFVLNGIGAELWRQQGLPDRRLPPALTSLKGGFDTIILQ